MKTFLFQLTKIFLLVGLICSTGCGPIMPIPPTPTFGPTPTSTPEPTSTLLPTVTPIFTQGVVAPAATAVNITATPAYYSVPTAQPNSNCLPPLTNFAFPVGVIRNKGNIPPRHETLPPQNWQVEVELPKDFKFFIGDITILENGNIWIKGRYDQVTYFIYRPGKESGIYLESQQEKVYQYYVPEKLFQTRDGALFGVGTAYGSLYGPSHDVEPLISRFNESTGKFEYIGGILHDVNIRSWIIDAHLDSRGFIWLLLDQSAWQVEKNKLSPGLYRFDPNTNKVDYFLATPDNMILERFMHLKDGSIWLLGGTLDPHPETVLLRYFPDTGNLQPYQGTFSYFSPSEDIKNLNISSASPLFLDSENRLWISNEGWLNNPSSERPVWHRVIQSPVFINGWVDGVGNFYRSRPWGMNQSSDGMFWFWGGIGTIRLDPIIGEWCLFTTYASPVVEDKNHTLWMVADNKLYKYQLPAK